MSLDFLQACNLIKKEIVPYQTEFKKIRLGEASDGSYVILDTDTGYDALYSYGSDDNIKFERSFYEKYEKPCYVYDHTIEGITNKPDYIHFFKEGVAPVKMEQLDTIDAHIEKNGHSDNRNLFAQIDIEGSEWVIFHQSKYFTNFKQIVIELHLPENLEHFPFIMETLRLLNEHYVCAHVHGNNSLMKPWLDHNLPCIIEVTYIRKDVLKFSKDLEIDRDHSLNTPNDPARPDMPITWY
jgi:hypothetical protein